VTVLFAGLLSSSHAYALQDFLPKEYKDYVNDQIDSAFNITATDKALQNKYVEYAEMVNYSNHIMGLG